MALNRRTILANLKTVLSEITEVKTVVRSFVDLDIKKYSETELPLISIREPAESPDDELVSMRAMQNLELKLRIYFVYWDAFPLSSYETLTKAIRDKIGSNFTLNSSATKVLVTTVSEIRGEIPLYDFDIVVDIKYYLNQTLT